MYKFWHFCKVCHDHSAKRPDYRQQTLGAEHPDVATCCKNVATVLRDQGDLLEAKEYHERTLAVRQETLGPQHPDVASSYKKYQGNL